MSTTETALAPVTVDFEGHPVTAVEFEGRPAWVASQVGAALGYAESGRQLAKKLAGEWSEEFIPGTDFETITNGRLAVFKSRLGTDSVPSAVDPRTPSLVILYESGLHLALLKTRKPAGRRLRRFLATEVLPKLARGAKVVEAPGAPPVLPVTPPARPELAPVAKTIRFDGVPVTTVWTRGTPLWIVAQIERAAPTTVKPERFRLLPGIDLLTLTGVELDEVRAALATDPEASSLAPTDALAVLTLQGLHLVLGEMHTPPARRLFKLLGAQVSAGAPRLSSSAEPRGIPASTGDTQAARRMVLAGRLRGRMMEDLRTFLTHGGTMAAWDAHWTRFTGMTADEAANRVERGALEALARKAIERAAEDAENARVRAEVLWNALMRSLVAEDMAQRDP